MLVRLRDEDLDAHQGARGGTEANPHQQNARRAKAARIADYLVLHGCPPSQIELVIEHGDGAFHPDNPYFQNEAQMWAFAAKEAGTNPPTSPESKQMVLEEMRRLSD